MPPNTIRRCSSPTQTAVTIRPRPTPYPKTTRLQRLAFDLAEDCVADYNWITPDQYNDMHSGLSGGFAGLTGDAANIRQGDNALSRLVPLIMSSKAYKDGGVIILWWDESESDGESGDNPDDFNHTIGEIIISPETAAC